MCKGRVRLGAVGVATMVGVEDDHRSGFVIDSKEDAVLATLRPPESGERLAQWSSDRTWSLGQRTPDELPGGEGN